MSKSSSDLLREARHILSAIRFNIEGRKKRVRRELDDKAINVLLKLERLRLLLQPQNWAVNRPPYLGRDELTKELRNVFGDPDFQELGRAPFMPPPRSLAEKWVLELRSPDISVARAFAHLMESLISSLYMQSEINFGQNMELEQLRKLVPPQKIAPVQFSICEGRLKLLKTESELAFADKDSAEIARDELISRGEKILSELERSNCDRRLEESVRDLQDQLLARGNAIRLGLSNIGCDLMCSALEFELPDAVNAMLRAYTRGIDLFVAQFPDWNRFLENAAAVQIGAEDVREIHDATKRLVAELGSRPDVVDPEVPRTLARLNELLASPGDTAKRATFAMLRSIENLISRVFSYGVEFLEQTAKKAIGDLSSVASKALVITLLTLAVTSAGSIAPLAGKFQETIWLKSAVELVKKQIGKLSAE